MTLKQRQVKTRCPKCGMPGKQDQLKEQGNDLAYAYFNCTDIVCGTRWRCSIMLDGVIENRRLIPVRKSTATELGI